MYLIVINSEAYTCKVTQPEEAIFSSPLRILIWGHNH
jgi:hypothetical protein